MSGFIPKEQLATYSRWEAASFDARPLVPVVPEPIPEPEPLPVDETTTVEEVEGAFQLPTAEDIERIHNEAREEGYRSGFEEGRAAALEEGRVVIAAEAARFSALTDALQAAMREIDQSVADHLLELGLEVAKQVLQGHLQVDHEVLVPIIREALAALPLHHGQIHLHVNPEDAAFVRSHLEEHFAQSGVHVLEDRNQMQGGCMVRAGSSEIDASLPTRWKQVLAGIGARPEDWDLARKPLP